MANSGRMRRGVISISDAAALRIKALLAQAEKDVQAVRISVNSKGCSGLAYKVDYVSTPDPMDEKVEEKGVTVYVDPAATLYILGSEMDYVQEKLRSAFEFRNPNEAGRCGCGESFYVDRDKLAQMAELPGDGTQ